jgi:hypothetical protein
MGLTEIVSAGSASDSAPRVQRAAHRASDIHGARKEVGDHRAPAQDGYDQNDLLKS